MACSLVLNIVKEYCLKTFMFEAFITIAQSTCYTPLGYYCAVLASLTQRINHSGNLIQEAEGCLAMHVHVHSILLKIAFHTIYSDHGFHSFITSQIRLTFPPS